MDLALARMRHTLWLALGLVACGPEAGDATSDGATSTSGSTPTTGGAAARCVDAVDILQPGTDKPTGFVRCSDGVVHRNAIVACDPAALSDACDTCDPACTAPPNLLCATDVFSGGCFCVAACQTDADCDPGQICRCAGDGLGGHPQCIPAGCTDTAACGDELCAASPAACSPGIASVACTTPQDTCASPGDCNVSEGCAAQGDPEVWACQDFSTCGRPYRVDELAVTAPAAARDDWSTAPVLLDRRHDLAARWTRIALDEHASIASFAAFILDLLGVGAPATLVQAAQRALADEIQHARLCFAVASRHACAPVGPGPLPALGRGALELDDLVAAAIREACVGETIAALEVRRAAAGAREPDLAAMLTAIADDEQRHAALGWRFVRWALDHGADPTRAAAVFAAALADADRAAADLARAPADAALLAHGLLDPPTRADVWRRGLRELVGPAASALQLGRLGQLGRPWDHAVAAAAFGRVQPEVRA